MLRTLADKLYGKGTAVEWLKSKNSDEEIVFASAATILETTESTSTGWSLRRLFQHRGVVMVTRNQIALKDNFFSIPTALFSIFLIFSIPTALFSIFLIFSIIVLLLNQDSSALLGIVIFGIFIAQRLPYEKQIPLKDIQKISISELSFVGKYSLLTVYLKDKAINIVPAQILNKEVIDIISPSVK